MADEMNPKKIEADQKRRFELHVMLICEQDRVPKSKAHFMAWLEGPGGLTTRLAPKVVKP